HRRALIPRVLDPSLLPLQPPENLPLPPLSDSLDGARREVRRRLVLKPRAQKGMDVRMRRATLTAVLVDREDALDSTCRAAEGLVYGVTQNALGQAPVQAREALGRAVVHREDEPEVDWVPEASGILDENLSYGPLLAAEG